MNILLTHAPCRAYDRAAILMRGPDSHLNFPAEEYADDDVLKQLALLPKREMVLALRRTVDTEVSK